MEYGIGTTKADEFIDITNIIRQEVGKSGIKDGLVIVFIPHTTAGVTINENADPDVAYDMLSGLKRAFPESNEYRHREGNSHAHIKASLMGSSCSIIIENGQLKLGTWQGVYFCEFDGPRNRKIYIKVVKD
jgi:secondary thiamine-phosphate synthase enzyme